LDVCYAARFLGGSFAAWEDSFLPRSLPKAIRQHKPCIVSNGRLHLRRSTRAVRDAPNRRRCGVRWKPVLGADLAENTTDGPTRAVGYV